MSRMLFSLVVVLVLAAVHGGPRCSTRRFSSLQFSVMSKLNRTGHRIVTVDLQSSETEVVGVSVDHWMVTCDGEEVVVFNVSANAPGSTTDSEDLVTSTRPPDSSTVLEDLIPSTRPPVPLCLSGYELLPGVGCYKDVKKGMTREQARLNCEADGAHLAVPNTQKELDFFKEIFKRPGSGLWLGIKKTGDQWRTDSGSSNFIGWGKGEPTGSG